MLHAENYYSLIRVPARFPTRKGKQIMCEKLKTKSNSTEYRHDIKEGHFEKEVPIILSISIFGCLLIPTFLVVD
jgi:hypothetical protein